MKKDSFPETFALLHEHWRPEVVAELSGQEFKLVKFAGTFAWLQHPGEDELSLVWRRRMTVEFRDHEIDLDAGEFCVVPRGTDHPTSATAEAEVLIFEPAMTRNTGQIFDPVFTAPPRQVGLIPEIAVSRHPL